MTDKILVTYSTVTGSTKGVSEAIGKTLIELGEKVEVIPMQNVTDVTTYKAVVAGSAIQAGKWLPEAMEFVRIHKVDLRQRPFAAFLVCMTLAMPKGETYRDTVAGYLKPVSDIVTPVSEGLFKGILEINKIPSFSHRLKFRISVMLGVWKEGDHRDWNAIRIWAKNVKSVI